MDGEFEAVKVALKVLARMKPTHPFHSDDFSDEWIDDVAQAIPVVLNAAPDLLVELAASRQRVRELEAAAWNTSSHPDTCPVTGRPFFMVIEAENGDLVATYGGPFDSYTIPAWDEHAHEFRSERFDHDRGEWIEGGEPFPFELIHSETLIGLESERDDLKATLASREAALREIREKARRYGGDTKPVQPYADIYDRAAQEVGR